VSRRPTFGATAWDLVEAFFAAQRQYQRVYSNYETRVLHHAELQAVDRHQLRLEASEVSKLLDFAKLGDLRNGPLYRTKEISHSLFRTKGRTHKFDRYISEIFHDLSILREEQYKVETFAEDYKRDNELAEYESLLDEVHEDFPRRVHNIWALFQKAQLSLEVVLRPHSSDPIYVRSLFLFGEEVLHYAYRRGKSDHCWRVFEHGPAQACLRAARSFAHAGFKNQALDALDDAIAAARAEVPRTASSTAADQARLEAEATALCQFVSQRSSVELVAVESLVVATEVLRGDDAAPGLEDDFGSQDETEFEQASASDMGFI
jgi:hypothetical protein